jgi:hypothetical protein
MSGQSDPAPKRSLIKRALLTLDQVDAVDDDAAIEPLELLRRRATNTVSGPRLCDS